LQHAFDGPDDPIALHVYEGRDGAFALYDDDGLTNAYESGSWMRVPITWREDERTLTLGERVGDYAGVPKERTFEVVFTRPGRAVPYGAGHGPLVRYEGRQIVVRP
jgi:alpha-D-xyloside xylohydrolase